MTRIKSIASRAGAVAFLALAAPIAFAQTSTTTPTVPDTGVGGDAVATMMLLAVSAAAAIGGAFYLANRKVA